MMESAAHLAQTMYWTTPTAIFFLCIGLMLAVMTGLQLVWPTTARRGVLPMVTTRGERLFIGLLGAAWIHLCWLGFSDLPLWWGSIIAFFWFVLVMALG